MTRKLETVFERRQANVLAEVITIAYSDLVKTGDFNELKEIVRELAEAQKRTDQSMGELAEAQKHTDQSMGELAEAQKRTEARVDALGQSVGELTEAQKRTEARVDALGQSVGELTEAQKRTEARVEDLTGSIRSLTEEVRLLTIETRSLTGGLHDTRSEVGGLSRSMSYALENEAYRALPAFLKARHGLELTERLVRVEVGGEEINFFGRGRRDSQQVLVIGETKLRLDERRATGRGAEQILEILARKAAAVQHEHPGETIVPLLVTHFARPGFLKEAEERGVIVVQSFEW
jgi:exonuclease VII small subunit